MKIVVELSLTPSAEGVLRKWASVGRSLDRAIEALEGDMDVADEARSELAELKYPLDSVHQQIRAALWSAK